MDPLGKIRIPLSGLMLLTSPLVIACGDDSSVGDAGADAALDAGMVVVMDAGADAAADAAPDASPDASLDAGVDPCLTAEPMMEGVQRSLLEAEGVLFDANGKIKLARYRWQPRLHSSR